MKKIITIISLFVILFIGATSCKYDESNPKELKVTGVYSFNGHTYYSFKGFYGLYLMDFDPTVNNRNNNYTGLRSYYDGFTDQVVNLLEAKDKEIETCNNVIKAYEDYLKINGIIE